MNQFKPKKCKHCKNVYTPQRPLQSVCSPSCATQYSASNYNKEIKAKKKEEIKKMTEALTNWGQKLVVKIQEISRLIDKGQPCLARGVMAKQFHGGHVFSKGSNPQIKYNLHNIHRQSAQSNHFGNDDGSFREGLAREYGQEYLDFIAGLRQMQSHKIKNEECLEFYKKACKIAAELKKEDKVYDKADRIKLRNEINYRIGIYSIEHSIFEV